MATKLWLVALPLAGSTLYFAYLAGKVPCRTTPYLQDPFIPLPGTIKSNLENYIVYHERAETSVSVTRSQLITKTEMLTYFLRATMSTFSRSLPAWSIWYLLLNDDEGLFDARLTLDLSHIRKLQFVPGDRVCGVYVVRTREQMADGKGEMVAMELDAPRGYAGPHMEGTLCVEVKEKENEVHFVNHTIMWKKKNERRSAGVLESGFGRWFHGVMVRRLMLGGVKAVMHAVDQKKQC